MKLPFRPSKAARGATEFYLCQPENRLLVWSAGQAGLTIRATADNFTPEQKEAFVHYLCAEGFISNGCEPPGQFHERVLDQEEQPVRWIVDSSWPDVDPLYAWHIQRLCWWTAGTMMAWLALVAVLVCC